MITCYENKREHIHDDEHLRHRYPIGGPVAKGACRQWVTSRLGPTGRRWPDKNAQGAAYLRAIYLNGD